MPSNFDSSSVVTRLSETDSLLDVMIQIEDYMDSLDIWAFSSWFDGEIVDGPWIERYWVKLTLKYPYKKMPDPQGGLRLAKYGSKIFYEKAKEEVPVEVKTPDDLDPKTRKPKMEEQDIWLIHLRIPRRFIDDLDVSDLELYDEEVNIEDVEDAQAEGIDNEAGIKDKEFGDEEPIVAEEPEDEEELEL